MTPIVVLGAGGHARAVIEILRAGGFDVTAVLDPRSELWGTKVLGAPVLGGDERLEQLRADGCRHAFIGVGSVGEASVRRRLFDEIRGLGFETPTAVHAQAIVSPSADLGAGAAVMAAATVGTLARVGENSIVNTGAIVEHDCVVESHAHVASGACLGGGVQVGEGAHVGLGASVREGISIGAGALVAAGAVVIRDVPPSTRVAGVPATELGSAR